MGDPLACWGQQELPVFAVREETPGQRESRQRRGSGQVLPLGVAETPDLVQILLNRDLALLQEKKYHEVQEHLAPLYRMHALTISPIRKQSSLKILSPPAPGCTLYPSASLPSSIFFRGGGTFNQISNGQQHLTIFTVLFQNPFSPSISQNYPILLSSLNIF